MKAEAIIDLHLYKKRVAALAHGRGGKKAMGHRLHYFKDEHGNLLYVQTWRNKDKVVMASHAPDDVITILLTDAEVASQTMHRRLEKIVNMPERRGYHRVIPATFFVSDKSRHSNKKQPIRVINTSQGFNYRNSIPYYPGLQVKNGLLLNHEMCVDYVRRLSSRSAAAEVRAQIEPLHKLLKVLTRMGHIDLPKKWVYKNALLELISDVYNPTADDAALVYKLGTQSMRTWRWPQIPEDQQRKLHMKAAATGMKYLREQVYKKLELYEYVPVER